MIKITFPDGSVREYNEGVTGLQIAESISARLAQDVLACGVNGETYDLSRPIQHDASIVLYKWDDEEGKHAFWHTSAHLLAEALQELYPGIQFGIGPAIENGFYYDVDPGEAVIKESDLPAIEAKMAELAAKKETLVRRDIAKADALKMFGERGETYKCELISELEDGHITTYTQGAFTDLCRGPHLMSTAPIKAIKLLSVAGAYWRGHEDRKQLTRIYGITFPKKKMLDEYLVMLEEAKKRDHRKIGKEMDLFMFSDTVGKGLPMWLPKGTALRLRLQEFLRRIQSRYDYQEVMCPPIGNKLLYITSGHYAKYGKEGMYLLISGKMEPRKYKENVFDFNIASIKLLQDEKDKLIENISITLPIHDLDEQTVNELTTIIHNNPGNSLLYFKVVDGNNNISLNLFSRSVRLTVTKELVDYLTENEIIDFKING